MNFNDDWFMTHDRPPVSLPAISLLRHVFGSNNSGSTTPSAATLIHGDRAQPLNP